MVKKIHSKEGPTCPSCGFIFTPDEGIYYDPLRYTSENCQDCGTEFTVVVEHTTVWITQSSLGN